MKENILVTGGAGYVGSILCEHLLNAGYTITVLDNLYFAQQPHFHLVSHPNYNFIFGDARDNTLLQSLVPKFDIIIPLAAVVGAPACNRDPWMTKALNFDAIKTINDLRTPSQLLLFPNTNSGYGTKSGDDFCTEETPLEPISTYGQTKCAAEKIVLDKGNSISFRLATVFGASPRMRLDLLVNTFVYAACTDRYLVIFEKDFKRNFVHVRDVADCFIYAINNSRKMAGNAYNLGLDSANISKDELALKIKEQIPDFYIHYAEIGVDPDKRNYIVSNEKLRRAGFEASRSIEQGIKELIKCYSMFKRSVHRNV